MSWVTAKQAANFFGCSDRSIRRMASRDELHKTVSPDGNGFLYWINDNVAEYTQGQQKKIRTMRPDLPSPPEGRLERTIYIPDPHIPVHDKNVLELVLQFTEWFRPDIVFVMGDVWDAKSISKYSDSVIAEYSLSDELDHVYDFFLTLREIVGKDALIVCMLGNHEARWEKYLMNNAPALLGLEQLAVEKLLKFDELDVDFVPYNYGFNYRGRHVEHGKLLSNKSGYTSHRLLEKKKISGVNGHCHRLGHVYNRCEGGEFDWVECGTLQRKDPPYIGETSNWQWGCAVSYWKEGWESPKMEIIHIDDNYNMCYAGNVFELTSSGVEVETSDCRFTEWMPPLNTAKMLGISTRGLRKRSQREWPGLEKRRNGREVFYRINLDYIGE